MNTSPLFRPLQLGPLSLPNRMVMAPLTRCRSSQPGDVPNAMMAAAYYAQRARARAIASRRASTAKRRSMAGANPDLPARYAAKLPLAAFDGQSLFGGDDRGYTDYPAAA